MNLPHLFKATHSVSPSSSFTSSMKPFLTSPIFTSGTVMACTVSDPTLGLWHGQLCVIGLTLDLEALSWNPLIFESYTGASVFASSNPYLSPHILVSPRFQSCLL